MEELKYCGFCGSKFGNERFSDSCRTCYYRVYFKDLKCSTSNCSNIVGKVRYDANTKNLNIWCFHCCK